MLIKGKALSINAVILLIVASVLGVSCKQYKRNASHADVPLSNIREGAVLAERYCQSCHQLPDPALLDAKTWETGVLPNMGPRLGIFEYNFLQYPNNRNDRTLPTDYYPAQPVLGLLEWQHIIDYYTATSPDSMPGQQRSVSIQLKSEQFKAVVPKHLYGNPTTSLIKINSRDTGNALFISDVLRNTAYFFNSNLKVTDSITHIGSIVDADVMKDSILLCNIGFLNPNNGKFGKISMINRNDHKGRGLFDSLQRPVQVTEYDLNNDGRIDYLICAFGYLTGGLYWMENLDGHHFQKHTLRALPGAIKAYIQDYNHDGLPDLWVLFAQGEEGIFLFTNKGNGRFEEQEVLRFPPVYGSSYFEFADFNHDGYPDILYTCGDNADYSTILKPYHGVYIFMNDKNYHFKQSYFFPINGCYKAIARDFDGDGDLDIATISFFADYTHQPEEGFVYLKNNGNLHFQAYTLPEGRSGRWLTMEAGDVNGDGKPDLVLGNFSIGPVTFKPQIDWKKAPPFLVLKNTGK